MKKIFIDYIYSIYLLLLVLKRSKRKLYKKIVFDNAKRSPETILRILGNGNSLNEKIKSFTNGNVEYMVVNRHVLSDSYSFIKPKYYVLADEHFFIRDEGLNILKKIKKMTKWKLRLFVPFSHNIVNVINLMFLNDKNIEIVYYNATCSQFYDIGIKSLIYFLYDKNLLVPRIQNVIVAAIYLGINMNYKNIELYGVEHSWTKYLYVDENNDLCLYNSHFYDKQEIEGKKVKDIQYNPNVKLHSELRDYANMFASYWLLNEYAKSKEVEIINCTKGSFIDAFKRSNY